MPQPIIRSAKPKDWEEVQKLNNDVFVNDTPHDPDLKVEWPYSPEGVKYYQEICSGKNGNCLIAEIDGKTVGYAALEDKDFDYRNSKYVEVSNIGVSPEFRSQGIGKMLIKAAEEWAKQRGATHLYVSAYWKNKRAIAFYKKSQFFPIGLELEKKI